LGCIAYEIMALKAPFSGNNPLFIAKNIVSADHSADLPEQYSEELKNIVKLCMEKDQANRPDARELLKLTIDKLTIFMDELQEKESLLND
jgi:serine/threonine protein kinase